MEQETLYNILTGKYGEILETHAMWECIAAVGAKLSKDGNMYCFLWGDNIKEGVCGFGGTIFNAACDFYTNIKTEEARKEESVGVAESPSKTFPRVNEFDCGSSYRH